MIPKSLKICQALMLAGLMSASLAAPAGGGARTYIVQLASPPTAAYNGGVAGLAATQVAEGERLDVNASHVKAYRGHLDAERRSALASVGAGVKVLHQYDLAFNGFSAVLTEAQVKALQASGKVKAVLPDERRDVVTVSTPHFLGLDLPNGVWNQVVKRAAVKGENVIIAVVDSGIQPENPAFYDRVDANGTPVTTGGTLAYGPPPAKWKGGCTTGPGFSADLCNNKLIGAKVFSAGFQAAAAAGAVTPFFANFYDVPRDEGGHGTHTLSTAGGNANSPAYTASGAYIGTTSGIAPRARLASYKALFGVIDANGNLNGSGFNSDLVAAINQAVADGVDVINYSVSGSQTNLLDPVELAFLNAAASGVFVAASAGNSGPGNQVAHPSPWLTTVAASTHDRNLQATLTLGNGATYSGASFNPNALPSAPMVLSSDAAAAGATATAANLCFAGALDPAKVAGKIVVCDRGTNARVEKSAEVLRAGGVGMVLTNPSPNTVVADFHSVPTVHLQNTDRAAVRAYAATSTAMGSISARVQVPGTVAPVMASFSSRGPNLAEPSVMKPEITGPGVDVIASVTYIQSSDADHEALLAGATPPSIVDSYSGTSMSSPHIAGVAALIKQAHPTWTPAMIKSAIITSASGVKLANGNPDPDRNGYGAGHVNPNAALNPGLVYPASTVDYLRFLCGTGWLAATSTTCDTYGELDPEDLNLPTASVDVPGRIVFKRKVKNVGTGGAAYHAVATVPGYETEVLPNNLWLEKGETASFTVSLKAKGAPIGTPVFGTLDLINGDQVVSAPVRARALLFSGPSVVSSDDAKGQSRFKVTYGFTGLTSTALSGLKPASKVQGTVSTDGVACFPLTVPTDALAVRAALYNTETTGQGLDDLDLVLVDGAGTVVANSGGPTANEVVSLAAPAAGSYQACVIGYAPQGGSSTFTLSSWVLSAADTANPVKLRGLPAYNWVGAGDSFRLSARWNGLSAGTRYLSAIRYNLPNGSPAGLTLLSVEPASTQATLRAPDSTPAKVRAAMAR